MAVERAPSLRVLQHPEDFEQPQLPAGTHCAYGASCVLNATHGYMYFRGLWYCLQHFARHGPLQL